MSRWRSGFILTIVALFALVFSFAGSALAANDPQQVQFTLEGCRNDGSITLPNSGGKFICPDGAYTSGNLGKGWNELDLVPYRLTADTGNPAPASQTYTIAIVLDYKDSNRPGYDVLSVPVLNTALSSASCAAPTVGAASILSPGLGGIDESLYRLVTITQAKNTECVYDYYGRLALGSHLFPGASLHANLANQSFGTAGIGARDVSIPVKEILPQELDKTMAATQDANHIWTIIKQPSPAVLSFENVCLADNPRTADVAITVAWEKLPATPDGDVTVVTKIYATNPASRIITVKVTDQIRSGTTVLDTLQSNDVDVPANTANYLVLEHMATVPAADAINLNDVATATYIDKVTGVPVPGNTTATASAPVQPSGVTQNSTATITDSESITGANLSFAVISTSGASGSFSGYTIPDYTTGPVDWTSGTQSDSGFVTFNKRVAVSAPVNTTGSLFDVATLNASDGFVAADDLDVTIHVNALVELTINKSIPNVLQAGESETFEFSISGPNGFNETASIEFGPGETNDSVTLTGLVPGNYSVTETGSASGEWDIQPAQNTTINLPNCAGAVNFHNTFEPASAEVAKITIPAGEEAGWEFTLNGPGTPAGGETVVTTGVGFVDFNTELQEGSYTITETPRDGYDQTGASAECSFTVDYPADAGRVFSCTYTNTQRGRIIVDKVTDPAGSPQSFNFTTDGTGYAPFSLTDAAAPNNQQLVPGTYAVSETVPAGWELKSAICDDGSDPAAIGLSPGETVTCTFFNEQDALIIVKKLTVPAGSAESFAFDASYDADGFSLTHNQTNNSGALDPGLYTVSETVPAGWDLTSAICDDGSDPLAIGLSAGETVTCTFVNTQRGRIIIEKQTLPDGSSQSFSFTGDVAGTLGDGQSADELVVPGNYSSSEGPQSGWDLTSIVCDDSDSTGDVGTRTASFVVAAGETVKCVFTNTQRGRIVVEKTVSGGPLSGTQAFTFQLRQGAVPAYPGGEGTILETLVANAGNGGVINFTTSLVPGQTYQLCEVIMPGWMTSLQNAFVPNSLGNPVVDNSPLCVNFTVTPGQTLTFSVDNTPPPGGRALTIGFWKNWASCANSNGKQKGVLDETLAGFPIASGQTKPGFFVGKLYVDTCAEAVALLNKSTLAGKKQASDPLFNLAAQFVAAKLNLQAGAYTCAPVTLAIQQAEQLFTKYNFDGTKVIKLSATDATLANNLAKRLDDYNNNLPSACQ